MAQFEEMLQKAIDSKISPVVKGFGDRLDELEKVDPVSIHTKGAVVDDGSLSQVGESSYKLAGGTVVNPESMWNPVGKGFRRANGIFEKLGEEAQEFFVNIKAGLKKGGLVTAVTKALDLGDVMRSGDDSSAGLFVPDDIRYALLQFAPPGTIVWPRAQVWPMTTDNIQWPKLKQTFTEGSEDFFGNVVMTWTEEGDQKTDTKAQFGSLALDAHELSAYTEVTDILLADSAINIGNLLVQLFQGAYWHYTDKIFLNGMGGTRPMGVLNHPGVTHIDRVEAGRIRFEDLLNMSSELPNMFDSGAVWMMKKEVFNSLRKQKDDQGRPVIDLGGGYNDFSQGIAGYIIGYPVIMSDYKTAALGSEGDVVLGDWKHYFIGERSSISIEMSRHVAFQHNRTAFRCTSRLGGNVEQEKAFVILNADADSSLS